jgi:hypothetical protein
VLALVERFRKEITAALKPPEENEARKRALRLVIDNATS